MFKFNRLESLQGKRFGPVGENCISRGHRPERYAQVIESLSYGLLPLSLKKDKDGKSKKLGIDDWLIGEKALGTAIANQILDVRLPLYRGDANFNVVMDPWMDALWKIKLAFKVGDISYDWLQRKMSLKDEKDDSKPSFKALPPINKSVGRDVAGYLVTATAAMGKAMIRRGSDTGYIWDEHKQVWEYQSKIQFDSDIRRIAFDSYKFSDGNNGITGLLRTKSQDYLNREIEGGEFVGVKGGDVHLRSGKLFPIDTEHMVFGRSQHRIGSGTPKRWLKALEELFGADKVELFRCALVLSYAPADYKAKAFMPIVVGPSGCGKSSIFGVLSKLLPGVSTCNISRLWGKDAMNGCLPISWWGQKLLYNSDFKIGGKIDEQSVGLLNDLSDGIPMDYRSMGKDRQTLKPTHRAPWVIANERPRVNSSDGGGYHRRFLEFYCQNGKRKGEGEEEEWENNIVKEEGPDILNWFFSMPLDAANKTIKKFLGSEEHDQLILEIHQEEYRDLARWFEILKEELASKSPLNYNFFMDRNEQLWISGGIWFDYKLLFERYVAWAMDKYREGLISHKPRSERTFLNGIEALGGEVPRRPGKGVKERKIPKDWDRPSSIGGSQAYVKAVRIP